MAGTAREESCEGRPEGDEERRRPGGDLSEFLRLTESRGWGGDHPYVLLLGLEPAGSAALVETIEEGLSFRELEHLQENFGLSRGEVAQLVQIKPRTLDRRRREGRLQPEESDRLLRLSRVFGKALELFEGESRAAKEWLYSSQRALGGAVPLEIARTDIGAREVEDLLGRLSHGVFT